MKEINKTGGEKFTSLPAYRGLDQKLSESNMRKRDSQWALGVACRRKAAPKFGGEHQSMTITFFRIARAKTLSLSNDHRKILKVADYQSLGILLAPERRGIRTGPVVNSSR